jgi:hypothetical protein
MKLMLRPLYSRGRNVRYPLDRKIVWTGLDAVEKEYRFGLPDVAYSLCLLKCA